jgi:hypothetical protein
MKKKKEPSYCCEECGKKLGRLIPGVETFHTDKCDICGKVKSICHVRRYNYLRK